jgi:hypothetical protein
MDGIGTENVVASAREQPLRLSLNYGALVVNAVFSLGAMIQFCRECWEEGWLVALRGLLGLE